MGVERGKWTMEGGGWRVEKREWRKRTEPEEDCGRALQYVLPSGCTYYVLLLVSTVVRGVRRFGTKAAGILRVLKVSLLGVWQGLATRTRAHSD